LDVGNLNNQIFLDKKNVPESLGSYKATNFILFNIQKVLVFSKKFGTETNELPISICKVVRVTSLEQLSLAEFSGE
jgi:hypothetical protein